VEDKNAGPTKGRPGQPQTYICQEIEGSTMFRKMLLVAVPMMACVMTLFVTDNGSSQAFAKGERGGRGFSQNHRGYGRDFRKSYRYGWGYRSYGYEIPVVEPVAPVVTTCEPVVAAPVAPVCSTCEPVVETPVAPVVSTCDPSYIAVESRYGHSWGFRPYRNHGPVFRPLAHRGGGRRG
jgi:hypothetical protein